jgi:hypothetical protein
MAPNRIRRRASLNPATGGIRAYPGGTATVSSLSCPKSPDLACPRVALIPLAAIPSRSGSIPAATGGMQIWLFRVHVPAIG